MLHTGSASEAVDFTRLTQPFESPADGFCRIRVYPALLESHFPGKIRVSLCGAEPDGSPGAAWVRKTVANAAWTRAARERASLEIEIGWLPGKAPRKLVLVVEGETPAGLEPLAKGLAPGSGAVDRLFNFGGPEMETMPGAVAVSCARQYRPGEGYGWSWAGYRNLAAGSASAGDSKRVTDCTGDGILNEAALVQKAWGQNRIANTFIAAVPNGAYTVTVILGNHNAYGGGFPVGNVTLTLNGNVVERELKTGKTQIVARAYPAAVTNGILTVGFESDGSLSAVIPVQAVRVTSAGTDCSHSRKLALRRAPRGAEIPPAAADNKPCTGAIALELESVRTLGPGEAGPFTWDQWPAKASLAFSPKAGGAYRYRADFRNNDYLADAMEAAGLSAAGRSLAPTSVTVPGHVTYDLGRWGLADRALVFWYDGGNAMGKTGVCLQVSNDGKAWTTVNADAFRKTVRGRGRYLRFLLDATGFHRSDYVWISEFRLWTEDPVLPADLAAIPILPAQLKLERYPGRYRHPNDDGEAQVMRHFPMGMAVAWEDIGFNLQEADWKQVERYCDLIRSWGCDTLYLMNFSDSLMEQMLAIVEPRGMRIMPMLSHIMLRGNNRERGMGFYSFDDFRRRAVEVTSRYWHRPGLLAWLPDEEIVFPEKVLRPYLDTFRRFDPTHPIIFLHMIGDGNRQMAELRPPALLFDCYPFQNGMLKAWFTRNLEEQAGYGARAQAPVWGMFQLAPVDVWPLLTPGGVRWQAWTGISRGIKGSLWYYSPAAITKNLTLTPIGCALSQVFQETDYFKALLSDCRWIPFSAGLVKAGDPDVDAQMLEDVNTADRYLVIVNNDIDKTATAEIELIQETGGAYDLKTGQALLPKDGHANRTIPITLGPGNGTVVLLGGKQAFKACCKRYRLNPRGRFELAPEVDFTPWRRAVRNFREKRLAPVPDKTDRPVVIRAKTGNLEVEPLMIQGTNAVPGDLRSVQFFSVRNSGEAGEVAISVETDGRWVYRLTDLAKWDGSKPGGTMEIGWAAGANEETLFALGPVGYQMMKSVFNHF